MASRAKTRPGRPASAARPAGRLFPRVTVLEDRTVPATFYVDPEFASQTAPFTFNQGYIGEVSGIPAGQAFTDLAAAIAAAEANGAEADDVRIARSLAPITVDNTGTTPDPDSPADTLNSVFITQPVNLIGSGVGATVLAPAANTQYSGADDPAVAVFRVSDAAQLTVSNLTFDGSGKDLGSAFNVFGPATATFSNVTIRNVGFQGTDGVGIVAVDGATVNFAGGALTGYGRTGILFQDSKGTVAGSIVTGSGAADVINNGIEVLDDSTVHITGNVITGNIGRVDPFNSTGVLVASATGTTATATLIGNTISGNAVGVTVGDATDDTSVVAINYNNVFNNETGVEATAAPRTVDAKNNWWGDPSGPFQPGSNPFGLGNPVVGPVAFLPVLAHPTPTVEAATSAEYLAKISIIGTTAALAPGTTSPINHAATPAETVTFVVTFAQPVTGFTPDDVTVSGPVVPSTGAAVQISGSGATYQVAVSGLSGAGRLTLAVNAGGVVGEGGYLNAASNPAFVDFVQPNTAPNITDIPNQTIAQNGTSGPITFTIGDNESQVTSLQVTATSSNPTLVPASGIVLGGAGSNRTITVTPAAGQTGTAVITVTVTDEGGLTATDTFTVTVNPVVPPVTRVSAVGMDTGGPSFIQVYNADGSPGSKFLAFEGTYTGGVRVATADVNGDGVEDIIVGAGVGGGPRVTVFSGADTSVVLANFFAYEPTVRNGAFVAGADLDGDGKAEIIVGAGIGGGPAVAVFTGTGQELYRFFAFENTARGGVLVAGGDVDGDGKAEIIAGAGVGGAPAVAVFNGLDGSERYRFFAYSPTFRSGVYVAAGDLNNDGKAEIIAGAAPGGGPQVRVVNGADGADLGSFFAYDPNVRSGVRVATGDVTGDGIPEVLTGPGPGVAPNVRGFNPLTSSSVVYSVFAFDPSFTGGVYVG